MLTCSGPPPGDARSAILLRRCDGVGFSLLAVQFRCASQLCPSFCPRNRRHIAARSIVSSTLVFSRVRGSLCFSLYGSVPSSLRSLYESWSSHRSSWRVLWDQVTSAQLEPYVAWSCRVASCPSLRSNLDERCSLSVGCFFRVSLALRIFRCLRSVRSSARPFDGDEGHVTEREATIFWTLKGALDPSRVQWRWRWRTLYAVLSVWICTVAAGGVSMLGSVDYLRERCSVVATRFCTEWRRKSHPTCRSSFRSVASKCATSTFLKRVIVICVKDCTMLTYMDARHIDDFLCVSLRSDNVI